MELRSFQAIMDALNRRKVRCLLVGGMAVVAHGYGRMTNDVDLVLDLDSDNVISAMTALAELGYRPRIPVSAEDFANPRMRARWIREKNMQVLNLYSERFRTTPIDLFVEEPFEFNATYDMAIESTVEGIPFRYVDINTLIHMKEAAGRPVDQEDVRQLRLIAHDDEPLADH